MDFRKKSRTFFRDEKISCFTGVSHQMHIFAGNGHLVSPGIENMVSD